MRRRVTVWMDPHDCIDTGRWGKISCREWISLRIEEMNASNPEWKAKVFKDKKGFRVAIDIELQDKRTKVKAKTLSCYHAGLSTKRTQYRDAVSEGEDESGCALGECCDG